MNTGQITFDAIASIVRRVKQTVESKNDQHGRNALLTSYIEYCCTLIGGDEIPYNSEYRIFQLIINEKCTYCFAAGCTLINMEWRPRINYLLH